MRKHNQFKLPFLWFGSTIILRPPWVPALWLRSNCSTHYHVHEITSFPDIMNINYTTSTITVARQDFKAKSGCPDTLNNITIDFSIFQYTPLDANLTLFYGNCSSLCNLTTFKEFSCPMNPRNIPVCWLTNNAMLKSNISVASCSNHLFLPIHMSDNNFMDTIGGYMPNAAWNGFELRWNANNGSCEACLRSGGQCGHEPRSNKFFCFCSDESNCPFPGTLSIFSL